MDGAKNVFEVLRKTITENLKWPQSDCALYYLNLIRLHYDFLWNQFQHYEIPTEVEEIDPQIN